MLHPYTNALTHQETGPLVIERGEGVHVFDDQGKACIEAMAGLWSVGVGFGEQRLVRAAAEQMARLPCYHTFSHKSHRPAIELAERLVTMTPARLGKVFFTSSGPEANDPVDKLRWYLIN
jgi:4-aminobutyrate--pyruvate transaminase